MALTSTRPLALACSHTHALSLSLSLLPLPHTGSSVRRGALSSGRLLKRSRSLSILRINPHSHVFQSKHLPTSPPMISSDPQSRQDHARFLSSDRASFYPTVPPPPHPTPTPPHPRRFFWTNWSVSTRLRPVDCHKWQPCSYCPIAHQENKCTGVLKRIIWAMLIFFGLFFFFLPHMQCCCPLWLRLELHSARRRRFAFPSMDA